jgi:tetratricopeptide (TPR) repeat protein
MRKLNVKLFLVLAAVVAVLAVGVGAVHAFQFHRIAGALLDQARRAEDAGNVRRMVEYLGRYLEFAPQDVAERAHYGRALASEEFGGSLRDRRQAVFVLDNVLTAEPNRRPERLLLVKTALDVAEFKTARDHLVELDKTSPAGDSAPAKADRGEREGYWGRLFEAERKPAEAIAAYRDAAADAPAEESNYIRLAYLLRSTPESDPAKRLKNNADADAALDALTTNNPLAPTAFLARWRYRRDFGLINFTGSERPVKLEVAAKDVVRANVLWPENLPGENDEQRLVRLRDYHKLLLAEADLARLQNESKEPEKAREFLQRGLKLVATPGYRGGTEAARFDLLWFLLGVELDDDRLDDDAARRAEAEETLTQLKKNRLLLPAFADYLQARLLIRRKNWGDAKNLLERARPALTAQQTGDLLGQVDLFLGRCYEQLEEPAQMERAFKRALDQNPASPAAHLGRAVALRRLGRLEESLDEYRQAMVHAEGDDRVGGFVEAARLEILRQLQVDGRNWDDADKALAKAKEVAEEEYKKAVKSAGDEPAREKVEESALKNAFSLVLLEAELLAARERLADAEKLLADAQAKFPKKVELWTARADLASRRKPDNKDQGPSPLAILADAEKDVGDKVELRVARAFRWAAEATTDDERAQARKKIDDFRKGWDAFPAADQDQLLGGLAEAQYQAAGVEEARALLEQLAQTPAHRTDLHLRLALFDLAVQRDDSAGMNAILDDIRAVEGGQGPFYGIGTALKHLHFAKKESGDRQEALDAARRELDRVAVLRPNWSPVFLTRADADAESGDDDAVIKNLQEAIRIDGPRNSPTAIQRLVETLTRKQRYDEAAEWVKKLRASLLQDPALRGTVIGVFLRSGNGLHAKELLDKYPIDSKNPRDRLLRAHALEATGLTNDAEAAYRRVTEIAPEDPAGWVALVQFLSAHDKEAAAQAVILDAEAKLAKDKAPLALAQCYEVLVYTIKADAAYDAALAARPDDPAVIRATASYRLRNGRLADAAPLLEKMAQKKDGASIADVEWAKRGWAIVLASSTDYRDFRKALGLVGLVLDDKGQLVRQKGDSGYSMDDRRAKGRVLATQPQKQFRQRAAELLESLDPPEPDDQFVLALLYDADQPPREDKELDLLRVLINRLGNRAQPQYLAQYAQVLIRRGKESPARLAEAAKVVDRLETMEDERKVGRGVFASVELRARWLEAGDKGKEALALLRDYASRSGSKPEEILLVVASLGRQRKFDEALKLCEAENIWERCKDRPEMAGGVSVALLRAMPPGDGPRSAVEGQLKDAIAKHPKLTVLKMYLADLCDQRGDFAGAELHYREVLKEEPGNVIALNNLAYLMTKQNGGPEEALRQIEQALNGIGRRPDLLDTRGLAYLSLNRTVEALADLTEATDDGPTPPRLFHLALAQMKARDRDKALKSMREAKERGLDLDKLHPTERQACQALLAELRLQ